ncbi:MAG TPA: hypothetical protein VMB80_11860 [Candidatus Acidoferrum sp.]|nr:hypothetical protein [Candidatus Acidoferrum sp.]
MMSIKFRLETVSLVLRRLARSDASAMLAMSQEECAGGGCQARSTGTRSTRLLALNT